MSRILLLVVVLAALAPGMLPARDRGAGPEPAPADGEQLREIVREHGIQTAAERPGLTEYVRDLVFGVLGWFARRLDTFAPGLLGALAWIAQVGAQVIFVAAFVLLGVLLARTFLDQYRRRRARALRQDPVLPAAPEAEAPHPGRPGEAWAEELRRRLASGDVAGACEALWWWLARTLVRGSVERSWTSRELLVRADRRDLRAPVRRLERMIYGAVPPTADEVRRLWDDLEEAAG